MLEQAVSKRDNAREKAWKKALRGVQIFLVIILVILEAFGFTISVVYWETDRNLFWQWIAMLAALGVPLILFTLLLQIPINKLRLEYDYTLQGQAFTIHRLYGSRRKWYLSFDLNTITDFVDVREIKEGSREDVLLDKAIIVGFNQSAPHMMLVRTLDCIIENNRREAVLVLELNEPLYNAFRHELRRILS